MKARVEGDEQDLPEAFRGAEILKFNIAAILGDLAQFGKYERTMRDLARDIVTATEDTGKKYIFYFDFQEIAWIHDKRFDLVADISTLFKYVLEETDVPVIAITSEKYYERFFIQNPDNKQLRRYFSEVSLEKLALADMQLLVSRHLARVPDIYRDVLPSGMRVDMDLDDTLRKAIEIMEDLFKDYSVPMTLLEIMDEIITEKVYEQYNADLYKSNIRERIIKLNEELAESRKEGKTELSQFLTRSIERYVKKWYEVEERKTEERDALEITFEDLIEKIAKRKEGVTAEQLLVSKDDKLDGLVPALEGRVVGQDPAIEKIFRKFEEKRDGLADKDKPFAALAFLGPTGVGKTELARALADYYFDGQMVRVDMSEYMEKHAVEKLFGAPGGYIGFEQGGILTNAVEKNPYSVILLDEIEKAHPETLQILNQILDQGVCTDGRGKEISFRNTIIIMTGNVGMHEERNRALVRLLAEIKQRISEGGDDKTLVDTVKTLLEKQDKYIGSGYQGFLTRLELYEDLDEDPTFILNDITQQIKHIIDHNIEEALEGALGGREIMGRVRALGGIVNFNALTRKDLDNILDIRLRELNEWLKPYAITLKFSDPVRDLLIQKGYNPHMGARPLARAIKRYITSTLADALLYNKIEEGQRICAVCEEERVYYVEVPISGKEALLSEAKSLEDKGRIREALEVINQAIQRFVTQPEQKELTDTRRRLMGRIMTAKKKKIPKDTAEEAEAVGAIEEKIDFIIKWKTDGVTPQGAALLDEEELTIEIPIDDTIQQQIDEVSAETGQPADELLQQVKDQLKEVTKWTNEKFDNLTLKAKKEQLPRVFANPRTFEECINVFNQKKRDNVFLIGGDERLRDSMIESFALASYAGTVPGYENVRVLRLKINEIIEYIPGIGMLEECMRRLIKSIEEDDKEKNVQTFVAIDYDELNRTVSSYRRRQNTREEVFNLGFFMIPFVGSNVKVIMSTRNRRIGEFDVVRRHFSTVPLDSMDKDETIETFLLSIKDSLEKQINGDGPKRIEVDYTLLETALELFEKYLPGEPYMETLLDFLKRILPKKGEGDEARQRLFRNKQKALQERLLLLRTMNKTSQKDLEKDDAFIELMRSLITLQQETLSRKDLAITEDDVIEYLVAVKNVSIDRINVDEWDKIRTLEETVKKDILYQDVPIARMVRAIKGGLLGLKDKSRPVATFLLNGVTGSGKTKTAWALSEALGWGEPIIVNLSRIKKIEHLSTLIGPPSGYIGYGENVDEYLTTRVIKKPRSVVVFDEVDKALNTQLFGGGRSLVDILLPIFEDARLQDSIGQVADFSQCIIIMTSNGGINEIYDAASGMFMKDNDIYKDIKELVFASPEDAEILNDDLNRKIASRIADYLRRQMRLEMLNRIDENIIYNALHGKALRSIVGQQFEQFYKKIKNDKQCTVTYATDETEKEIIQYIIQRNFNPEEGARALIDPIKEFYISPLNRFIGRQKKNTVVTVHFKKKRLTFTAEEKDIEDEGIDLSDVERLVLGKIVDGLDEKQPNEPILPEELAEWIDPTRRPIARTETTPPTLRDDARVVRSRTNDFFTRGRKDELTAARIKEEIERIKTSLIDPDGAETLLDWLISATDLGRRMNFQQAMLDKGKFVQDDLARDKPKAIKKLYTPYIETADTKYFVELIQDSKDEEIIYAVRFNTSLSKIVGTLLYEKKWQNEQEIFTYCEENKLDALFSFLSLTQKIRQLGLEINYSSDEEGTLLWLTVPCKAKPKPKKEIIAPQIETPEVRLKRILKQIVQKFYSVKEFKAFPSSFEMLEALMQKDKKPLSIMFNNEYFVIEISAQGTISIVNRTMDPVLPFNYLKFTTVDEIEQVKVTQEKFFLLPRKKLEDIDYDPATNKFIISVNDEKTVKDEGLKIDEIYGDENKGKVEFKLKKIEAVSEKSEEEKQRDQAAQELRQVQKHMQNKEQELADIVEEIKWLKKDAVIDTDDLLESLDILSKCLENIDFTVKGDKVEFKTLLLSMAGIREEIRNCAELAGFDTLVGGGWRFTGDEYSFSGGNNDKLTEVMQLMEHVCNYYKKYSTKLTFREFQEAITAWVLNDDELLQQGKYASIEKTAFEPSDFKYITKNDVDAIFGMLRAFDKGQFTIRYFNALFKVIVYDIKQADFPTDKCTTRKANMLLTDVYDEEIIRQIFQWAGFDNERLQIFDVSDTFQITYDGRVDKDMYYQLETIFEMWDVITMRYERFVDADTFAEGIAKIQHGPTRDYGAKTLKYMNENNPEAVDKVWQLARSFLGEKQKAKSPSISEPIVEKPFYCPAPARTWQDVVNKDQLGDEYSQYEMGQIGIDKNTGIIYAPLTTYEKEGRDKVLVLDPSTKAVLQAVAFPKGIRVYTCFATAWHLFVGTSNGVYVLHTQEDRFMVRDETIGDDGIIDKSRQCEGVVVKEKEDGTYEVYTSGQFSDNSGQYIDKYTAKDNYQNAVKSEYMSSPKGMSLTLQGELLVLSGQKVYILNSRTLKPTYVSTPILSGNDIRTVSEDANGFIYVTVGKYGFDDPGDVQVFMRSTKTTSFRYRESDKPRRVKQLFKIGNLSHPQLKNPGSVAVGKDGLFISSRSEIKELNNASEPIMWRIPQTTVIATSLWPLAPERIKRIVRDTERIGTDVGQVAQDRDSGDIYIPTGGKQTLIKVDSKGGLEEIKIGMPTTACWVTKKHIFVGTEEGVYVYLKDTRERDMTIGNKGVIASGKICKGLAVKEKDDVYEIFMHDRSRDRIAKYNDSDNYAQPVKMVMVEYKNLFRIYMSFNTNGELIISYGKNVAIIDPDKLKIVFDSGAVLNKPGVPSEDERGVIFVSDVENESGFDSDTSKIIAFIRGSEDIEIKERKELEVTVPGTEPEQMMAKKLDRVGEFTHPDMNGITATTIHNGTMHIVCNGREQQEYTNYTFKGWPATVWHVPTENAESVDKSGGNEDRDVSDGMQELEMRRALLKTDIRKLQQQEDALALQLRVLQAKIDEEGPKDIEEAIRKLTEEVFPPVFDKLTPIIARIEQEKLSPQEIAKVVNGTLQIATRFWDTYVRNRFIEGIPLQQPIDSLLMIQKLGISYNEDIYKASLSILNEIWKQMTPEERSALTEELKKVADETIDLGILNGTLADIVYLLVNKRMYTRQNVERDIINKKITELKKTQNQLDGEMEEIGKEPLVSSKDLKSIVSLLKEFSKKYPKWRDEQEVDNSFYDYIMNSDSFALGDAKRSTRRSMLKNVLLKAMKLKDVARSRKVENEPFELWSLVFDTTVPYHVYIVSHKDEETNTCQMLLYNQKDGVFDTMTQKDRMNDTMKAITFNDFKEIASGPVILLRHPEVEKKGRQWDMLNKRIITLEARERVLTQIDPVKSPSGDKRTDEKKENNAFMPSDPRFPIIVKSIGQLRFALDQTVSSFLLKVGTDDNAMPYRDGIFDKRMTEDSIKDLLICAGFEAESIRFTSETDRLSLGYNNVINNKTAGKLKEISILVDGIYTFLRKYYEDPLSFDLFQKAVIDVIEDRETAPMDFQRDEFKPINDLKLLTVDDVETIFSVIRGFFEVEDESILSTFTAQDLDKIREQMVQYIDDFFQKTFTTATVDEKLDKLAEFREEKGLEAVTQFMSERLQQLRVLDVVRTEFDPRDIKPGDILFRNDETMGIIFMIHSGILDSKRLYWEWTVKTGVTDRVESSQPIKADAIITFEDLLKKIKELKKTETGGFLSGGKDEAQRLVEIVKELTRLSNLGIFEPTVIPEQIREIYVKKWKDMEQLASTSNLPRLPWKDLKGGELILLEESSTDTSRDALYGWSIFVRSDTLDGNEGYFITTYIDDEQRVDTSFYKKERLQDASTDNKIRVHPLFIDRALPALTQDAALFTQLETMLETVGVNEEFALWYDEIWQSVKDDLDDQCRAVTDPRVLRGDSDFGTNNKNYIKRITNSIRNEFWRYLSSDKKKAFRKWVQKKRGDLEEIGTKRLAELVKDFTEWAKLEKFDGDIANYPDAVGGKSWQEAWNELMARASEDEDNVQRIPWEALKEGTLIYRKGRDMFDYSDEFSEWGIFREIAGNTILILMSQRGKVFTHAFKKEPANTDIDEAALVHPLFVNDELLALFPNKNQIEGKPLANLVQQFIRRVFREPFAEKGVCYPIDAEWLQKAMFKIKEDFRDKQVKKSESLIPLSKKPLPILQKGDLVLFKTIRTIPHEEGDVVVDDAVCVVYDATDTHLIVLWDVWDSDTEPKNYRIYRLNVPYELLEDGDLWYLVGTPLSDDQVQQLINAVMAYLDLESTDKTLVIPRERKAAEKGWEELVTLIDTLRIKSITKKDVQLLTDDDLLLFPQDQGFLEQGTNKEQRLRKGLYRFRKNTVSDTGDWVMLE
ncbi:MAG: AAA family ATPase, partial [Candidatus Omnitrophica bacterium]|nr:AAA family ATPase [Candidatus Omnitrophota bacterium]